MPVTVTKKTAADRHAAVFFPREALATFAARPPNRPFNFDDRALR
jgi:hypothetical protein